MNLIPIKWSGYALALTGPEYCNFYLKPVESIGDNRFAELVIISKDGDTSVHLSLTNTLPSSWEEDSTVVEIEFENQGTTLDAAVNISVFDEDYELLDDGTVTLASFNGLFAYVPVPGPEDDDPEAVRREVDEIVAASENRTE